MQLLLIVSLLASMSHVLCIAEEQLVSTNNNNNRPINGKKRLRQKTYRSRSEIYQESFNLVPHEVGDKANNEDFVLNSNNDHRRIQQDSTNNQQLFPIPLVPFQIHLEYDNNDAMSNHDEMMVLSTTQSYLSSVLNENEDMFTRLILYQFVRDYQEESSHYAKVAFGGTAYFLVDHAMEQDQMLNKMWLGLIGENATMYVSSLQEAGMSHIADATLMSIEGHEMDYQNGEVIEMDDDYDNSSQDGQSNDNETPSNMMMEDMTMMTILLSLLIPASVICLAFFIFASRSAREIKWCKPDTNPQAPEWQCDPHRHPPNASEEYKEEEKVEEEYYY